MNIRRAVQARGQWSDTEHVLDGSPVLRLDACAYTPAPDRSLSDHPVFLATINDLHIRREGIGEQLSNALGRPLEAILVLSRHRAASGKPSFTAHPVGNPTTADAGGRPGTPTPTHPFLLSAAYRALRRHNAEATLPHDVALEATHHGPFTSVPVVFIEIGSDETHYEVPEAGDLVASAAMEAIVGARSSGGMTIMGVGGGHYAPRFSALLDETAVYVGHMLASYHWSDRGAVLPDVLRAFLEASAPPGQAAPDAVYVDRKSLPSAHRRAVLDAFDDLGVRLVRTRDLPPA